MCNISRLIFGFPRSFHAEEFFNLPLIVFNGPLILLLLVSVALILRRPRSMPPEIAILFVMALIYFGLLVYFMSIGGYKAVHIGGHDTDAMQ